MTVTKVRAEARAPVTSVNPTSLGTGATAASSLVQVCGGALDRIAVIEVVVLATASSQRAANAISARIRIPSYAVWEFAVFVLNVLAFILVGFQLKACMAARPRCAGSCPN